MTSIAQSPAAAVRARFAAHPLIAPFAAGYRHRALVVRLARREIEARFKGSFLGILWSLITPMLMLAVYTFVFSVVFQARWGEGATEHRGEFALLLFSGLIVFAIFSESINRAPTLMLENVSYINKIVFPLEALAWVVLLVALFNAAVSLLIWLVFYVVTIGVPPWTAVLLPVVLLPLVLMVLGLVWILSALGVFLRDIRQMTGVITSVLMFVSPVFFPKSSVPADFRGLMDLNPLTVVLEQTKAVLVFGRLPSWNAWALLLAVSWALCALGYAGFQRSRRAFADVI